tara:strand:- start:76 stop:1737 length:1662 start_codon:yes stop_codon:yes gene_type:complete
MLKIALLIYSNSLNKIENDFLNLAQKSSDYSVELIIIQANCEKEKNFKPIANFFDQFLRKIYGFTIFLDRFFARNYSLLKNSQETTSIRSFAIPHVIINTSPKPNTAFLNKTELLNLQKQEIDLIASCYFTNAENNFHLFAKMGLFEIFHGFDSSLGLKHGLIGLNEILKKNSITTFKILHNKKQAPQTTPYMQGSISTMFPFVLNKYRVERKAIFFLHNFIQKLSISQSSLNFDTSASSEHHPSVPATYQSYDSSPLLISLLRYICICAVHGFKALYARLMQSHGKWSVGLIKNSKNWKNINFNELNVIPNSPNHYLADPFLFSLDQLEYCFVEDYSFITQKGNIKAFLLDGDKIIDQGTVLDEPFHLSYPNIFKVENDIFMIPETAENKDIRIYKSITFPSKWVLHQQLMKDISAVDTNILYYKDRWWMFTNIDSADIEDYCSELHIFYADVFDSNRWIPHSQNPVITSALQARNGGCIVDESGLFRAFQAQDYGFYGKSIGIAKINTLTPDEYSETIVHSICPDFIPNIQGTHHIHFKDKMVAIDFFSKS